jgi:hypothetical protein
VGRVVLTVVTNSELGTFRTCRHRWHLNYEQRLSPKRRPKALEVGSAGHAGFDAMYHAIKAAQAAGAVSVNVDQIEERAHVAMHERLAKWQEGIDLLDYFDRSGDERGKLIEESNAAVREASVAVSLFVRAFCERDFHEYEVLEVEQAFDVPLLEGGMARRGGTARSRMRTRGKRDVVLRSRSTGAIVLGEHKTTISDASAFDARLDVDPQTRAYLYSLHMDYPEESAAGKLGDVLLNVVRKSGPKAPKVNKNGAVSVAACDTTRSIYRRALEEQEQVRGMPITDDQREFLDLLPTSFDRYVSRHEDFFDVDQIERWRAEAHVDIGIMRRLRSGAFGPVEIAATRNGASCTLPFLPPCAYRSICANDSAERREQDFVVRDVRHSELDSIDGERVEIVPVTP